MNATKSYEETKNIGEPIPSRLFPKSHLAHHFQKFISFHKGHHDQSEEESESNASKLKYVKNASDEAVVVIRTIMESMTIEIFEELSKKG